MSNLVGDGERHPALGPLCERCGVPIEVGDHYRLCEPFEERPGLWASGWASLEAFDLPPVAATGWPEVREGPAPRLIMGGFGPEYVEPWFGSWVRQPDRRCPTHRRLAALFVRAGAEASEGELVTAATEVIRAPSSTVERWLRPDIAIDTTACGRRHQVIIRGGEAVAVNHRDTESHVVDPVMPRFTSPLPCDELVRRWEAGQLGEVKGDLGAGPTPVYTRVGADPGLLAAAQMLLRSCLAQARCDLIATGEPDRWLALEAQLARPGGQALLFPSTRPIPVALVSAPVTWPWTHEPLA